MTSVSLVIMPSRCTLIGNTAASASATRRATRDSGSHLSSATQIRTRRSIPHSADSQPSAPASSPSATTAAAIA